MVPSILSIATALPAFCYRQSDLAITLSEGHRLTEPVSLKQKTLFAATKIDKRYSVLADFGIKGLKGDFFGEHYPEVSPSRMRRQNPPIDTELLMAQAGWVRALARTLVRDPVRA